MDCQALGLPGSDCNAWIVWLGLADLECIAWIAWHRLDDLDYQIGIGGLELPGLNWLT